MTIKFEFKKKKELKKFLYESSRIGLQRNIIIKKGKLKKRQIKFTLKTFLAYTYCLLLWIGLFLNFLKDLNLNITFKTLIERNILLLVVTTLIGIIFFKIKNNSREAQKKLLNKEIILTINKETIKMECIGREISTNIENIIAIIIGEYSINIVTNNDIVFNIPNTKEDEVISTLKTYKNDIKTIKLK